MLFALFVLDSRVVNHNLIFETAAFTVIVSIIAHGLTDTVGVSWLERRTRGRPATGFGP
jgi:NhaP-type Na+/H+ or K+/H+ antiporter